MVPPTGEGITAGTAPWEAGSASGRCRLLFESPFLTPALMSVTPFRTLVPFSLGAGMSPSHSELTRLEWGKVEEQAGAGLQEWAWCLWVVLLVAGAPSRFPSVAASFLLPGDCLARLAPPAPHCCCYTCLKRTVY